MNVEEHQPGSFSPVRFLWRVATGVNTPGLRLEEWVTGFIAAGNARGKSQLIKPIAQSRVVMFKTMRGRLSVRRIPCGGR